MDFPRPNNDDDGYTVRIISSCTVVPPPRPVRRCHLTAWDLLQLNIRYIQRGFLYSRPHPHPPSDQLLQRLKSSLAATLGYYYPAAGRLVTETALDENGNARGLSISIDCNGQGAEFVHAVADNITVAQVEAVGQDVPSFFPLDGAINYEGHTRPLVGVQLTELVDGFFVACSYNHCISDGHGSNRFMDAWAALARTNQLHFDDCVDDVYCRWFGSSNNIPAAPIVLPYTHRYEFIGRTCMPATQIRYFLFSAHSIDLLKNRANEEQQPSNITISSFQSVASLVWRAVTHARALPNDAPTKCVFSVDCRSRLQPPLSLSYMGNCVTNVAATTSVGELEANGVGFGAWLIHEVVAGQTNSAIRDGLKKWEAAPVIRKAGGTVIGVVVASSPRFDLHGYDFGSGKALAVRSGSSYKAPGVMVLYGGREGGGSLEMRMCLEPEVLWRLESDKEFMAYVK